MVSASLDDDDLQDMGHSPNVLFEECFRNISCNLDWPKLLACFEGPFCHMLTLILETKVVLYSN